MNLNTLFSLKPELPEGFIYTPDFLTMNEETELYEEISKVELRKMLFHGYEANRKQHALATIIV